MGYSGDNKLNAFADYDRLVRRITRETEDGETTSTAYILRDTLQRFKDVTLTESDAQDCMLNFYLQHAS